MGDVSDTITGFFRIDQFLEYPPLPRTFSITPPYWVLFLAFVFGAIIGFLYLAYLA